MQCHLSHLISWSLNGTKQIPWLLVIHRRRPQFHVSIRIAFHWLTVRRKQTSKKKPLTTPTARWSLMTSYLADSMKFQASMNKLYCLLSLAYLMGFVTFLAWTVSGGVTSHPVLRQVRLYPEPASAISARDISDTELTLSWKAPQGDWNSFEVSLPPFFKFLPYSHFYC